MRVLCLILVLACGALEAAPKHCRTAERLTEEMQAFAKQLSIRQRRIFCRQFNEEQRRSAIGYASGNWKDSCLTPDEAVLRVAEESNMPLTVRRRP